MSSSRPALPSDPDELSAFAEALQAELYAKTLMIEKLKAQLAVLRRARFGRSSEKLDRDIEQLELLIGDLEEGDAESQARTVAAGDAYSRTATVEFAPTRGPPTAARPPAARDPSATRPPAPVPSAAERVFSKLGEDEPRGAGIRAVALQGGGPCSPEVELPGCETIIQSPMPPLPIERGRPGPALLAHVAVAKYCDHLPLHRQSTIYAPCRC